MPGTAAQNAHRASLALPPPPLGLGENAIGKPE